MLTDTFVQKRTRKVTKTGVIQNTLDKLESKRRQLWKKHRTCPSNLKICCEYSECANTLRVHEFYVECDPLKDGNCQFYAICDHLWKHGARCCYNSLEIVGWYCRVHSKPPSPVCLWFWCIHQGLLNYWHEHIHIRASTTWCGTFGDHITPTSRDISMKVRGYETCPSTSI